jgi:hypothetical protein
MDVVCSGCGALHWKDEKLTKSSWTNPSFGMCCFSGKMDLPKLHEPPPELLQLLSGTDDIAKNFRKDIHRYNNALAMTSLGCKTDDSINHGGGPYVFKVHGKLTHRSGSLLPPPNGHPTYAQLYIYDQEDALNYRMGHQANTTLQRETMQRLQDMLSGNIQEFNCIGRHMSSHVPWVQTKTVILLFVLISPVIVVGTIFQQPHQRRLQ